MLLPFNFIGHKEIMKLLRNFHLTMIKQTFFLYKRAFYGLKNKKIYNNDNF